MVKWVGMPVVDSDVVVVDGDVDPSGKGFEGFVGFIFAVFFLRVTGRVEVSNREEDKEEETKDGVKLENDAESETSSILWKK